MDDQREAARSGRDWVAWHQQYEDPSSGLAWRLGVIQEQVRQALEELPSGPIRVISLCAGQGRDLIGALAGHDRRGDVTARLVELDPRNTDIAHRLARDAGLDEIEIVTGDASTTSAYSGSVPAQLILACGVFGNITDADVQNTVRNLARLAAPGATVLWTRHRRPPDLTPHIRYWFADAGFEEVSFEVFPAGVQTVGVHRLVGLPKPFQAGVKLFEFVGGDGLRHDPTPTPRPGRGEVAVADSSSQPDDDSLEGLLASQRAYYDLRAPDYGELSRPSDRPIRGMIPIELARTVVHDAALGGDVLELACGPGMFTAELARRARSVTAIDASPRMLERNRQEVRAANVTYVEADLFSWAPDRIYDAVFFGFWLSHVPTVRFDQFWALVASCIGGDGRVAFVDEDDRAASSDETKVVDDTPAASRRLSDGRSFDIVKLYWAPDDLERHVRQLGWDIHVRPVGATFLYGSGRPSRRPPR